MMMFVGGESIAGCQHEHQNSRLILQALVLVCVCVCVCVKCLVKNTVIVVSWCDL